MNKKVLFLLICAAHFPLFGQFREPPFIYLPPIPGASSAPTDNAIITRMIMHEIQSQRIVLLDTPREANLLLYGTLSAYDEFYYNQALRDEPRASATFSYNATQPQASPWDKQYIFQLSLRDAVTNEIYIRQSLIFVSIDDVYNFFPILMYNLFSHIPNRSAPNIFEPAPPQLAPVVPHYNIPYATKLYDDPEFDEWKSNSLYLRLSLNYLLTPYLLQETGLIAPKLILTRPTPEGDREPQYIDNRFFARPAATLGFELQFNYFCFEPQFQVQWDSMNDNDYVSMEVGLEVKIPIRSIRNVMMEPYGAVTFPIISPALMSEIYYEYPKVAVGGGFQFSIKAARSSAVFIDLNYLYYIGDVVVRNHYIYDPEPDRIYLKRSVIGLGLGFKTGIGIVNPFRRRYY